MQSRDATISVLLLIAKTKSQNGGPLRSRCAVSFLKELSRGLFFFVRFFLPVFPIKRITLAASAPCLQWVLFSCDTWCLVPLSLAAYLSLRGHRDGWGFQGCLRTPEYFCALWRARPGVPVPCASTIFVQVLGPTG